MIQRFSYLTGAGILKESRIKIFRDKNGLWNNHRVEDVATPESFYRNPSSLVYDLYNKRRKELNSAIIQNKAHLNFSEIQKYIKINIITQNIDNLHELSGNSSIIYMHGELKKARCISTMTFKYMIG